MLLTTTLFNLPQRPHCSAITRLENLGFYFWTLVFSSHTYFIVHCENEIYSCRCMHGASLVNASKMWVIDNIVIITKGQMPTDICFQVCLPLTLSLTCCPATGRSLTAHSYSQAVSTLVFRLLCNLPAMREKPGFDSWVGKIPWRRERLPTQCSGLENSMDHIYSSWCRKESDTTERLSLSVFFEVSVQICCPPLHLLLSFKNLKNLDINPFTDISDVFSQYVSCLFI